MLERSKFLGAYSSTYEEPSQQEVNYVMEQLGDLGKPDFFIRHEHCSLDCGCAEDVYVNGYKVVIPDDVAVIDLDCEDRILSVLECSVCGQWVICD